MTQKKQRGLTLISWMIVLSLVGIQALMALRIVPVYMNFYSAKNIMEEVKADTGARGLSPKEVQSMIGKRVNINGLYELEKNMDAFTYTKSTSALTVTLHYEARGPIISNLEFVATFDYEIEIPSQ